MFLVLVSLVYFLLVVVRSRSNLQIETLARSLSPPRNVFNTRALRRASLLVSRSTKLCLLTLILSIPSLYLLMLSLLHLSLQDSRSRRFIESCSLQDMCRIDIVVVSAAHNMLFEIDPKLILPDWNLMVR